MEINELRETVVSLQQQLQIAMVEGNLGRHKQLNTLLDNPEEMGGWLNNGNLSGELQYVETNGSESDKFERNSQATSKDIDDGDALLQSQILMQVQKWVLWLQHYFEIVYSFSLWESILCFFFCLSMPFHITNMPSECSCLVASKGITFPKKQ